MSRTLIDCLLAGQADLTAVERFARKLEDGQLDARKKTYEALLPVSTPGRGEQYAFAVDLDRCTGCKACVAACHSFNGLMDEETWRETGLLLDSPARPRHQTVTSACHHCADPACLDGCPVLAYEKDPETGIVRHLDDQCIGCQYCILKCPYEVPKYSKKLGIVRKCDLCHSRLAAGEAPACVQACPTGAIAIRVISTAEIQERAERREFLPDSPDPRITRPSTTYFSKKPLTARAVSADHRSPVPQHTHWPLVGMLVLTQAGTGALTGSLLSGEPLFPLAVGTFLVLAGLLASVAHLGQPWKAWRAFLGWRTSWLSREVMVLGAFGGMATLTLGCRLLLPPHPAGIALLAGTVVCGWLGVLCSAWVYHDTHRTVWRGPLSFGRFFLTSGLFALAVLEPGKPFAALLALKLLWEIGLALRGSRSQFRVNDLDRSALLLRGPLLPWFSVRLLLGLGALTLALAGFSRAAVSLCLAGEIVERALFFQAGIAKSMPGHQP